MAKVTFNGAVQDKETGQGLPSTVGMITVTEPDASQDTISVATAADGTFSVEKDYGGVGDYTAVAHFEREGYNPADSPTQNFTVAASALKDMTVTLNVSAT